MGKTGGKSHKQRRKRAMHYAEETDRNRVLINVIYGKEGAEVRKKLEEKRIIYSEEGKGKIRFSLVPKQRRKDFLQGAKKMLSGVAC